MKVYSWGRGQEESTRRLKSILGMKEYNAKVLKEDMKNMRNRKYYLKK